MKTCTTDNCEWKVRHDALLRVIEVFYGETLPPGISLVDLDRELTQAEYNYPALADIEIKDEYVR
jgi:hypothetical protein